MAIPGFRYPTRLCYFRCLAALADISPVGFVGLIIFIAVDFGTNFGAAATMLMDANGGRKMSSIRRAARSTAPVVRSGSVPCFVGVCPLALLDPATATDRPDLSSLAESPLDLVFF